MEITILGQIYTGETLVDMARVWNETRDRLDFGASTQCGANITQNGEVIARVSYNGRLWDTTGAEICEF